MEEKEIFFFDFYYSIFPVFISNKQKRKKIFVCKYFQLKTLVTHQCIHIRRVPCSLFTLYTKQNKTKPTSGSPAFWPAQHIDIRSSQLKNSCILYRFDTYTQKYVDLFLFTVLSKFHFAGWEKKKKKNTTRKRRPIVQRSRSKRP